MHQDGRDMGYGGYGDGPSTLLFKRVLAAKLQEDKPQLPVPSRISSAADSHLAQDQVLPRIGISNDC